MINARAETLSSKPNISGNLLRKHLSGTGPNPDVKNSPATGLRDACIVPASGYYEWQALRGDAKSRWLRAILAVRDKRGEFRGRGRRFQLNGSPCRAIAQIFPGPAIATFLLNKLLQLCCPEDQEERLDRKQQ